MEQEHLRVTAVILLHRFVPIDNTNENGYRSRMDPDPNAKPAAHLRGVLPALESGRVTSRQLLGDRSELVIEHQGREYRLRLTQNGKLILTA